MSSAAALPILYSFRRCPFAMRARLALAASHTRCELREIVLRAKPAQLLEASPKGTVPVLVLPAAGAPSGQAAAQAASVQILEHSLDIMRWALERNDPEHWLLAPTGTLDDMLALIGQCDGPFKQDLDRYKYPERYPDSDPVAHRSQGSVYLRRLDGMLANHPYLFGERPTLADRAIAPFVRQFAHTDKPWFGAQPWPALQAWLEAFLASALFERVMQKYPRWEAGHEIVVFPPRPPAPVNSTHLA